MVARAVEGGAISGAILSKSQVSSGGGEREVALRGDGLGQDRVRGDRLTGFSLMSGNTCGRSTGSSSGAWAIGALLPIGGATPLWSRASFHNRLILLVCDYPRTYESPPHGRASVNPWGFRTTGR
jgi:hypothetical protein